MSAMVAAGVARRLSVSQGVGGARLLFAPGGLIADARELLFSTSSGAPPGAPASELHDVIRALVPVEQQRLRRIKAEHGDKVVSNVTVSQVIGGMRGIPGLLWETSLLDAESGIHFRGIALPECLRRLPRIDGEEEPRPEGMLWLLLTKEIPTKQQVLQLSSDLGKRALEMPNFAANALKAIPKDTHPMTQLSLAVLASQHHSKFNKAYIAGVEKTKLWEYALEDSLDLIASLPVMAGMIYRRTFLQDDNIDKLQYDTSLDWSSNLAKFMGVGSSDAYDMMRMYMTIHTDHEGGNVSAHTTHLVASALSDPYLSYAAGMTGLAGPLHGLANQEVLKFIKDVVSNVGISPSKESLEEYTLQRMKSGRVVPGFGHAVLRVTDPRYTCQREFAMKHMLDDPMFKLVSTMYEVIPDVLMRTGKVKNPWPNVDGHSGIILQYYGINAGPVDTEESFYTVLFGVARAMGVLSQLVWDRALGLPIERPKSLTMACLEK